MTILPSVISATARLVEPGEAITPGQPRGGMRDNGADRGRLGFGLPTVTGSKL
jgi:hypothetical protein